MKVKEAVDTRLKQGWCWIKGKLHGFCAWFLGKQNHLTPCWPKNMYEWNHKIHVARDGQTIQMTRQSLASNLKELHQDGIVHTVCVCLFLRRSPLLGLSFEVPTPKQWSLEHDRNNIVGDLEVSPDSQILIRDIRKDAQVHHQLHSTHFFLAVSIPTSELSGRDWLDVDEPFQRGAWRCASVEDGVPGSVGWCRNQRKHTDLGAGCHKQAQLLSGCADDTKKIRPSKWQRFKVFWTSRSCPVLICISAM